MMAVPLYGTKARGRVAWVSEGRYDQVACHRWWVWEHRRPNGSIRGPYAMTTIELPDGRRIKVRMHNLIMGCKGIDHENGYGLDNTDRNLRKASVGQNQRNRGSRGGSSAYKGVCWDSGRQKWLSTICLDGRRYQLGRFAVEADAARAYNNAALVLHGEFARLNVIG